MLNHFSGHWRSLAKVFVILNAFTWSNLMLFAPSTLTYQIAHSHGAGHVPTLILLTGMVVLIVELALSWVNNMPRIERLFTPVYMLMGAGYFIFAYMCAITPGSFILMVSALVQSLMCGLVALLQKLGGE